MAKQKDGVNKSEEIRKVLGSNPGLPVRDVVSILATQGVTVTNNLVYFIKGKMKGEQVPRRAAPKPAPAVFTSMMEPDDTYSMEAILKVKAWADEFGGLQKLKALVDALSE